jgi:uncharacterized protein (TIGR00297 family)
VTWLTPGGVAAALLVGAAVFAGPGGGWRGLAVLAAFFVSSSALTRRGSVVARGRAARQVLANGGVAALAAVFGRWTAVAGALAAATADTWATEIGRRARRPPRLITTGVPVPPGTSGGITPMGTAGGALGALAVAALAAWLGGAGPRWFLAVAGAGTVGMLVDSLAGATLERARGVPWVDNDVVNLLGTLAGAMLADWLATP